MRMIILAAGRGERLMPLTRNTPKPLIDIGNGNTLLEEQVQSLKASGIVDEIVIVVGYLAEQVEAKIGSYNDGQVKIRTIFNPFWQTSNNLMSLWMARYELDSDDILITNGDNIFTPEVFKSIAQKGEGVWLTVSPKVAFDCDDMKVKIEDNMISHVAKTIPAEDAFAESPGLAMVRGKRARGLFLEQLEAMARDPNNMNRFWLEIFNRMWMRGMSVLPFVMDMKGKWQEVDFHLDVPLARALIGEKMKSITTGELA